jgi:acetyl-CoA carboxylase biotin carboxyl carrier protein
VELEWPVPADHSGPARRVDGGAVSEAATEVTHTVEADVGTRTYVRAPMVGTFYHAPEPGAAPFVTVGDHVEAGQQVGIVEAMKLMNPVEAADSGRVIEVLVADAGRVEYEQPLIELEPADPAVD